MPPIITTKNKTEDTHALLFRTTYQRLLAVGKPKKVVLPPTLSGQKMFAKLVEERNMANGFFF